MIAPVERLNGEPAPATSGIPAATQEPAPAVVTEETSPPEKPRSALRRRGLAAAAVALLLGIAGIFFVSRRDRRSWSRGPIRALAVLPFENLSRDPEQDYFADGITEALI